MSDNRQPQFLISEFLKQHYGDVGLLISCGDMDPDYLDFIASVLSLPLYYVRGNHDHHYTNDTPGGIDLHLRTAEYQGVLLAGMQGSIRYNKADLQYSDAEMYVRVLRMMPGLLARRMVKGYGVDIFAAHSPPRNINDTKDYAHRGFRAFRWLIRWGQPRYLIHGHVDLYDQRIPRETQFLKTRVVNINPSRVITIEE
ncbi:MAG: hypothetical protein HY862_08325 [Chloroflexi bacterium]|nr:hypothetical protein [Chloroflexota bacterium]